MSTGFKPKFLVLVPYHPFSKSSGHQKITKQLLIFNDAKSTTVRSRIWMHLSSLKTAKDGAVVLHLAPSHPHPGDDFVTTFDRGHCLFLKEENPTPDAMERFKKLLTILKEASAVTTVTTKAQPNDSIALKSDSSAASFNSSGTLTDSSKSRPPAALDSGHLADNSGSGDLKAPTKPIHKEYAGASPEGRSLPSSPLREQQLQQVDQHQHQQQQQQQQQHTPFSVEKAKEHHHSQSFSDLNGSQPPSAMNSARSTPHKRSNSIWSKSDVQAAVTTPTPPSKQAGTHEPAAPAEAAAAVTQHPLATAAETGLGTATPGSAVGQSVGGAATVTTPMDVCRHAAASPANHAAAAASPANHAAAVASPANHAAAAASPANHAAAAASPANHAAAAASPAHHAAAAASPANHAAAAASPANHAAAASPDGSACSSMSLKADEDAAQPLQALQKEKAAAIQEQLWAVEEKKLGIQEQRLRYHLEQEEQAASEESKKKAGEIKQQLWAIEERKLVIQEERLRFQLQQEA
ncbi:hypothetical protein DUNSADRAFT_9201 [Dunaliella salina]|uniref:Uncharacterized protein n=1 Tax=Dunaliella salina TaxID=3046 RepID=A0ABQ7GHX2_DUNSA|nr:hypothetical protein DUNSADRAFT_9201 [Dunaliella salina]|eukprot:KAF5834211.1 hypothetical protein DUNSADRAFT_9201 [Dunaliella salina]